MWPSLQMSREPPPPLPGGWEAMDPVYFTGDSKTFDDGDKLVHGQQGVVVGPAALESYVGKALVVQFPGNMGSTGVGCLVSSVRRRVPALRASGGAASVAPASRRAALRRCRPSLRRS